MEPSFPVFGQRAFGGCRATMQGRLSACGGIFNRPAGAQDTTSACEIGLVAAPRLCGADDRLLSSALFWTGSPPKATPATVYPIRPARFTAIRFRFTNILRAIHICPGKRSPDPIPPISAPIPKNSERNLSKRAQVQARLVLPRIAQAVTSVAMSRDGKESNTTKPGTALDDDMPAEIDFSKAEVGKFYRPNALLHIPSTSIGRCKHGWLKRPTAKEYLSKLSPMNSCGARSRSSRR
jgi:hypothetical protein